MGREQRRKDSLQLLLVSCDGRQQLYFPPFPIYLCFVSLTIFHHCPPFSSATLFFVLLNSHRLLSNFLHPYACSVLSLVSAPRRVQRAIVSARVMAVQPFSPSVCRLLAFSILHLMPSLIALLEHPFAKGKGRFGRRRSVRRRI